GPIDAGGEAQPPGWPQLDVVVCAGRMGFRLSDVDEDVRSLVDVGGFGEAERDGLLRIEVVVVVDEVGVVVGRALHDLLSRGLDEARDVRARTQIDETATVDVANGGPRKDHRIAQPQIRDTAGHGDVAQLEDVGAYQGEV